MLFPSKGGYMLKNTKDIIFNTLWGRKRLHPYVANF